jgi:hypothetical protein
MCFERRTCPYSLVPDVGWRSAAPVFLVTRTHTHTHFSRASVLLMRRGRYFLFRWVTSGICIDSGLVTTFLCLSTFFQGDFACTLLWCRRLLRIWLIFAYLNLAPLCLPVIFTGICFLCPQCHLEFESRNLAAIHYTPPSSSVGLHVFIPGNISVLSGGTAIL